MPPRRRSRNLTPSPSAPPAALTIDDLLLPVAGPNAVSPDKLTARERMNEIVAILARGMARRLSGIRPFAKPPPDGAAFIIDPPLGRAT